MPLRGWLRLSNLTGRVAGSLRGAAKLQVRFLVARIYHNVSIASVTRPAPQSQKLLGLDARRLDYLRPLRQFSAHEVAQFLRRARRGVESLRFHHAFGVGIRKPLAHELIEPRDDRRRR